MTPPSTTILVLLDGRRVNRATAAYEYCDTVKRFARTAVDRSRSTAISVPGSELAAVLA